ncbi:RING finger protein 17 isoform X2 [Notolabrus celidotus]|uniref:RING finger protein 17 isoform X2 n=1 Tax=Notolabrus celidotus TaxID=1203425 RepID=UPI0014908962|nr:RING finger protein 17 isoform X2 [Notolabrus celidotus]
MDRRENPRPVVCWLCGEAFTLPEDEGEGNLPRVLLCSHIYCTSCLLSIQCDGTIKCPECEVESTLPEGGVNALQEDSRIIGLIYTAKINKMKSIRMEKSRRKKKSSSPGVNDSTEDVEQQVCLADQKVDVKKTEKSVDEALVRAAGNLALLEHIHETLKTGLTEQVKLEQARLEKEIKQSSEKAFNAIQKWKDVQLSQLNKLEARFSTSRMELGRVQERIKSLGIAMQMAREVCRVPFLEQYCTLDKVLETLQAPVDKWSFNTECITVGSGLSCVFQSEGLNQSLSLSLKMIASNPKRLSEFPPKGSPPSYSYRKSPGQHSESRNINSVPQSHKRPPSPQKQEQGSQRANSPSPQCSPPNLRPHRRASAPLYGSTSDIRTPDVIVEEIIEDGRVEGSPPTGPELANDKWRIQRKRKSLTLSNKRSVNQWVVVTHVVNPSHFYVRYMAERRGSEILSSKIHYNCCSESCRFTAGDTVETGSLIFVKQEEGLWCRGNVVEVSQIGCVKTKKACPASQLASISVFLIDCGQTKNLTIQSEEGSSESSLKAVNNHLRKVSESLNAELSNFAAQAIRCCLKDLVPYDLSKGWSEKAQVEFCNVVGSAAVEMRPFGQDQDSLLVDLRKAPMDQSSDVPISVREYLVFIEVARFYSPVSLGRKPLSYYPPVYPKMNTEVNAVVSHINSPADFYIQLVDSMESLLLSAKLQECYNATTVAEGDDLKVYCPVIEQAYVARYEDKLWYRAQVIGHPGERKVEVRYVDFGNKKVLTVSDLRKIKDEFFALPSMAIRCCLSDVNPVDGETWSEACIDRFIKLAHQKLVTIVAKASVPKTRPLPVKLFESGLDGPQANIAELLVKEELACFREDLKSKDARPRDVGDESTIWDPPLDLGSAADGADAPDQKLSDDVNEEPLQFQPQLKLPAQLKDLKVRVSHVNSPSSFYVQLTQNDSQLRRICELVKKECAPVEPDEDAVWKADMYCAAHINGVWERGQLCSDVISNNIAEVMRCDHGSKVKVHVSSLRPLPQYLIGSLALECTLTDIRPAGGRSTWTATACDSISYYLTGASAVMTIKELTDERPQPITLCCSNKMGQFVSIADFLTSEGLALRERKPRDAGDQKPKPADAQSPVSVTHTPGPDGDKADTLPPPSLLPVPSKSPVIGPPTPTKPTPCTIMSAEADAQSPVSMAHTPGPDGDKPDTLPPPSLLPVPFKSPVIGPPTPTKPAPCTIMSAEADAQSPVSVAHTPGPDGDKPDALPFPYLLPFPPISPIIGPPTPPKPAPRTIISAEKVKTQLYQPPELPCLGHIQINVSAIGEDGYIYVRTKNAECQLKQLRKRIQQSIKTLPRQKPYTWKSVLGCAVIGSDMLWYRGQLLDVLGGYVKVQYVDHGLVENIPVVHVHPMLLCEDVPQLCMPCQLHSISPVGGRWQRDAVALLRELLLNRCVDMQVMELPSDPRAPLPVELFLDGMSLSKIVSHHERTIERTASELKGSYTMTPPPFLDDWDIDTEGLRGPEEQMLGPYSYPNLPQEGEHFKVRVKHLWTPNELFLWPLVGTDDLEVYGETLDAALTRINEDIDGLPRLTNFPHGGPCLAEYSDGKYYRAKLIKITSIEPVMLLVQHVDFGSDDTLPPSKLRQMPVELLGFPSRALKVKVAGFKAPSVKTEEGMLPYSPGWSVKATMAMMDLLHNNITASVVARDPELTVLLFNEGGDLVHESLVSQGLADFM